MTEHIQKKARYEKTQDQMPLPPPDIAAVQSLYDRSQEEDESTRSTINYSQMLLSREICCGTAKIPKFPNIFRDYFLQLYDAPLPERAVDFVIAGDIVVLNCDLMFIFPYRRDGGGFLPLTDKDGTKIQITKRNGGIFYNNHNNSLIIAEVDEKSECTSIVSLEIESIKAGLTTEQITICPEDINMIGDWDIDIPNCRGMLYNKKERLFKVFELKKYTTLFTIPKEGDDSFRSYLRFGSSGNMELIVIMFNKISSRREEILLTIYSKLTGQLRKRISIPVYPNHELRHVQLYGTDRILVQQSKLGMQIFDIAAQISKVIKTSDFEMVGSPQYLYKRNLFIGQTEMRGMRGINVFNLQGFFTINISSILTGKCIGKITADPSHLRKSALRSLLPNSIAYDETTNEIFTGSCNGNICIWSNKAYNDINNKSTDEDDRTDSDGTDEDDNTDSDGTDDDDTRDYDDNSTQDSVEEVGI